MLTVIARTVKLVKENYGIDVNIRKVNLNDKETFQLYQSGQLVGVFQCENAGMQKTMRLIGVDRFEDVVAGVALYRPGPMASIPEYAARKMVSSLRVQMQTGVSPAVLHLNVTHSKGLVVVGGYCVSTLRVTEF